MRNKLIIVGIIFVLPLTAGTIIKSFSFSMADLRFEETLGYDVVSMDDAGKTNKIGRPLLPRKLVNFLIPPDAEVVSVTVISKQQETIPGSFQILPAQRSFPLSQPELWQFVSPDRQIYASKLLYPAEDVEIYPSGSKGGYRISGIGLYPVHYNPAEQRLVLTTKMDIKVEYLEGQHRLNHLTERQAEIFGNEVEKMIENPEDLVKYRPPVRNCNRLDVENLIITTDDLESYFSAIAEWRTKQGWYTETKTTTWIYANYSGVDEPEKIRNFIKDCWLNSGLVFVLLGGDNELVPVRKAYLPYYGDPYIPTDLYYSDLDGSWNANGNSFWGEMEGDEVDIYSDVFVGRMPAKTTAHVLNYIDKCTIFEKQPPPSYLQKILLPSVKLFFTGYHGRAVNNAIADSTPPDWCDTKLEDPPDFLMRDSLNQGYQFCHPAAHGNETGFYTDSGTPIFTIEQVASLTNDSNYTIMNSIACYTGNFEDDCIAESLVNKYPGGCIATIMNTRSGWGAIDGFGFSEKLDMKFYGNFFNHNTYQIGRSHANSKDAFRDDALTDTVARYCLYTLTLFGDPLVPMWENIPTILTIDYPPVVPTGNQNINITVTSSGSPIGDALVCLYKPDEVHEAGYTNNFGAVTLSINPLTSGTMFLTVTAKDHYPCEKTILVEAGMPTIPKIIKPLNFARLPDLQPVLSFYSTDPNDDSLCYRVIWDTDPNFASPESSTTSSYASGSIVNWIFPSNLVDGATYWWKVKCTDPSGSGYWTNYTFPRSFTIDLGLPNNTCSWFQTTGAQFSANTCNGTQIQGDSVILVPTGQTIVDTLLIEDFEGTGIPPGWTVIDGNNDGYKWTVGTTSDIGPYQPPDYGTKYAYYSDDDAGNSTSYNEELISPAIYIPDFTEEIELIYCYGFYVFEQGEKLLVKIRKNNDGNWSSWVELKVYTASGRNTEFINLTPYLPADSMQFEWFFSDSTAPSHWGYACANDNVVLRYSYTPANNYGTMTGVGVSFQDLSLTYSRQHWGDVVWHKATAEDSIGIQVEYSDSLGWHLVPESDLPGNSAGFYTPLVIDSIDIHNLDTLIYQSLRLKALFHRKSREPNDPALLDWEIGNLASYGIEENTLSSTPYIQYFAVYPNPFNGVVRIAYCVERSVQDGTLRIYDATGRLVKSFDLESNIEHRVSSIVWQGDDDVGRSVAAGVYFVKFEVGGIKKVKKVVLIK